MTTPIVTERGRLTALRAAALFDGTRSALVRDPLTVIDGDTITTPRPRGRRHRRPGRQARDRLRQALVHR